MKKYFIIILIIVFVLSCSACGNKSQVIELNTQIQDLEVQLDEANKMIEDLQRQVADSGQTIQALKKQIEGLEEVETKQDSVQEIPKANTDTSKENNTSENQLGDIEEEIFKLLSSALYRFDNPASVRVVKFHAYKESEETYYLTLTSENFLGGNLTDLYELSEDGAYGATYTESQLSEMRTILGLRSPSCNIAQINQALEEYCQSQGLYQQDVNNVEAEENTDFDNDFSGTGNVSGGGTFKKYNFD